MGLENLMDAWPWHETVPLDAAVVPGVEINSSLVPRIVSKEIG